MTAVACKDCRAQGVETVRPAPHPGPRCATHNRVAKRHRATQQHARRLASYGLSPEDYEALYKAQGGRCAICRRATGATKRLAVHHDHDRGCGHDPKIPCRKCVDALLCGPCNQMLGRYDEAALWRAISVRRHPPARRVLKLRHRRGNLQVAQDSADRPVG